MISTFHIALFALACIAFTSFAQEQKRVVTLDELQSKNGKESNEMWLSILGQVYDVSDGKDYYKEGSPYHIFIGRDASASFVTGNFTEAGAQESLLDLDPPVKLTALDDW
jgi:predicted heme/steroid binding protein